jgi:hypothetical protein
MAQIFKAKKKKKAKVSEEEPTSVMGNDSLIRFRSKTPSSQKKK